MKAKCIYKIRDKKTDKIIGYRLMYRLIDTGYMTINVEANALKEAIRRSKVEVCNLTLTSDNRLITTGEATIDDIMADEDAARELQITGDGSITDERIVKLIDKARKQKNLAIIEGKKRTHSDFLMDNEKIYIIERKYPRKEVLVYIADGVKEIGIYNKNWAKFARCKRFYDFKTTIIGGKGLTSAYTMFNAFERKCLDLSELDTSNVTNMERMFSYAKIKSLVGLEKLNTSKVESMKRMFWECSAILNLSNFDTSNVNTMEEMFEDYAIENTCIDVSHFDTSKLRTTFNMFTRCKANKIIRLDGKCIRDKTKTRNVLDLLK